MKLKLKLKAHFEKGQLKFCYISFILHGFILVRGILRNLGTMQNNCTALELTKKSLGGWYSLKHLNLSAWQESISLSKFHREDGA